LSQAAGVLPRSVGPTAAPTSTAVRRRVCVISEDLAGVLDEGKKKFAFELAQALGRQHDVALLTTRGSLSAATAGEARPSRTFLSKRLRDDLVNHRPEVIVYLALSSTGFATFLRCRVLKSYCPGARVVLIGLQPRHHNFLQRRLIRHLAPDLICVQSTDSQRYLERLGCRVELLPSGVDLARFQPASPARRRELKVSHGFDPDRPVALHVGHLQSGRGVRVLSQLAAADRCQVALVASSSTDHEPGLAEELRAAGVIVMTHYLPHVEQLYQLADCYVFPVLSALNSIETPLSVLEAFACDLPVATTRFGGLPRLFEHKAWSGLVFVDSPDELAAEALRLCRSDLPGNRALALSYSWDAIGDSLLERAISATGGQT
jgi:glycosyltransferase involved in cell wall biosynthesis